MSVTVGCNMFMEKLAKISFGINNVPPAEQDKMIARMIKAAAKMHEAAFKEGMEQGWEEGATSCMYQPIDQVVNREERYQKYLETIK